MRKSPTSVGIGPRLSLSSRRVAPYVILILGLLFTFIVSFYLERMADLQDRGRFRGAVEEIDTRIRSRILTYIALLRAGTGLFAASESVTPDEFKHFVEQIDLPKNYPGVQGIGYSIRLRPDQTASSWRRSRETRR